ncbi:MAG: hypothetical protein JW876_01520 [Candidatus Krumholzibacteriota bacterium]|nr:hypothetical protein [Candidatus Krumholzibacteriota bacterium]
MRKALIAVIFIALASSAVPGNAGEFTLRSRSLMQGPAATGAFVPGGFALATGGGIAVIDTADATKEPAWLPLDGMPRNLIAVGSTVYVAAGRGGLCVLDLADPSRPRVAARRPARRAARCEIAGGFLYLLNETGSILTFDITDPFAPAPLGERRMGPANDIVGHGSLLVVSSSGTAGIFRVETNGGLTSVAEIVSPEHIRHVAVGGDILHLVLVDGTVARWRIDDPASPVSLEPLAVRGAVDLDFAGREGLVCTKAGEYVPFRAETNARTGRPLKLDGLPAEGGVLSRIRTRRGFGCSRLVAAERAFMAVAGKKGCAFFRRNAAGEARFAGRIDTSGFAIDLVTANGLLYLANGEDGVRIGEIGQDGSIEWIGHLQTTVARDVAVKGDLLVLCDGNDGLKTIDVSDPRAPRLLGRVASSWFLSAIVLDGVRAYVAGGLGGAEIFDVAVPESPSRVWRRELSEVRGVHVENGLFYLADGRDGMRIYRPGEGAPEYLSRIDTPGWVDDVFVVGGTAYLADGGNGLKTIDVSDPSAPRLLGEVDLGGLVRNIHVRGKTLFAACHTGGIVAVDVSEPAHPVEVARHATVDDARGVWADERFVYLGSASGGVYVFSYTD